MAIFTQYMMAFLDEVGFTMANIGQNLAIIGVLIGSIVWVVIQLIIRPLDNKSDKCSPRTPSVKDNQPKLTLPVKQRKQYSIVSSFHLNRKSVKVCVMSINSFFTSRGKLFKFVLPYFLIKILCFWNKCFPFIIQKFWFDL